VVICRNECTIFSESITQDTFSSLSLFFSCNLSCDRNACLLGRVVSCLFFALKNYSSRGLELWVHFRGSDICFCNVSFETRVFVLRCSFPLSFQATEIFRLESNSRLYSKPLFAPFMHCARLPSHTNRPYRTSISRVLFSFVLFKVSREQACQVSFCNVHPFSN
jgi:hypothetical protein